MKKIKLLNGLVLGSLVAAMVACSPAAAPKTDGQKALEGVAQSKGFTGAVSSESIDVDGQKFRISTVEKPGANNKTEALMVIERADGSYEINAFSAPTNLDEVSADQLDSGFTSQILNSDGTVRSSMTLGEAKDEVNANFAPVVWVILRTAAVILVRAYGRNLLNNGCNWLVNKVKERTGWTVPGWFQQAACRYISDLIVRRIVEVKPQYQSSQHQNLPANFVRQRSLATLSPSNPKSLLVG